MWIYAEDTAMKKPPEWLVDGLLTVSSVSALVSAPNVGKTFIALDLGFSIAAGVDWHGYGVRRGGVAYIASEGYGGLTNRVRAWRVDRDIPPGADVGLWFWDRDIQLANRVRREQFRADLHELKTKMGTMPILTVIDTLNGCFIGQDENAAGSMGEFLSGVKLVQDVTGGAVLILHHSGWRKRDDKGRVEDERERGSTALRGAVDLMMLLQRGLRPGELAIKCTKNREGELWEPLALQLRQVEIADGISSCVVDDGSYDAETASLPPRWLTAIRRLGKFGAEGATFSQWLNASGLSRDTFGNRMLKQAIQRDLVAKEGERYVLKVREANPTESPQREDA